METSILFLSKTISDNEQIITLLQGEGYTIKLYSDIDSFLIASENYDFNLMIIDFENNTPQGIQMCTQIKSNFMLKHIPLILLVTKNQSIERIKGIYAGADDYIEKPHHPIDLLTRIKANIWRAQRDLDANPLTKLPGNASILKELEKRIDSQGQFCIGYADLDKFKKYNDYCGFELGDKIIQHTASLIYTAIKELGSESDFLGHIGGDDFIFITSDEAIDSICKKIIYDFDLSIPSFYKDKDREKSSITTKDRSGIVTEIGFLTITLGVASNKQKKITHTGQIIQIATELKNYGKSFSKSICIFDRRNK